MTNWPNIQEYRSFEAKFIDDPKHVLTNSAANSDLETVIKDDYTAKHNADDLSNNQKLQNSESKIVRCVIKSDFEETIKKVDREDGLSLNHEHVRPKPQETTVVDRSLDKVRLQNHLKWMKQKEEEYQQKKEAEKIAQQKKKEEQLRLDKMRKQKEREREEKIKEWQEQKLREKEEKKKEKMVLKVLEEGLKVTPSVDKEKLLEEWVKLKNKQKQIETEKKAELLKKEEESKALRQTLAELSYRQWKERIKGRMMTLPKNGYQIFGPKPVPVVKEDWNHDFTSTSPRNQSYSLRGTGSHSTTTLTLCNGVKEFDDLSKDIFYLEGLKSRSPSFYHMGKSSKSGSNFSENCEALQKGQCETTLKEWQPGTTDLQKKGTKKLKNGFERRREDVNLQDLKTKSEISLFSKYAGMSPPENHLTDFTCFPGAQGDQLQSIISSQNKWSTELLNAFPDSQILPSKKKIDIYINNCPDDIAEYSEPEIHKKPAVKSRNVKNNKDEKKEKKVKIEKAEKTEKKAINAAVRKTSKDKFCPQSRSRSLSFQKSDKSTKENLRSAPKNTVERENQKNKSCRRSQSYDKSKKKVNKNEQKATVCSTSKSMVKIAQPVEDSWKSVKSDKNKTICSQKRKSRKSDTSVTPSKSEKKLLEVDHKTKKKMKRKNSLSKSVSFIDSPYCAKTSSKTTNKVKPGRRKNGKDVETKSDGGGHRLKLSTTKI